MKGDQRVTLKIDPISKEILNLFQAEYFVEKQKRLTAAQAIVELVRRVSPSTVETVEEKYGVSLGVDVEDEKE